jgi:hypothetical protein
MIGLMIFVSNAVAHADHVSHNNSSSAAADPSSADAMASLASSYPSATTWIAVAEIGAGLLLLGLAVRHFYRN